MRVSVVIPALNEAGNIGRLVEETYRSVPVDMLGEVIVIDDASTDATGAEVTRAGRPWPSPGTNSPQDCLCPGSA